MKCTLAHMASKGNCREKKKECDLVVINATLDYKWTLIFCWAIYAAN